MALSKHKILLCKGALMLTSSSRLGGDGFKGATAISLKINGFSTLTLVRFLHGLRPCGTITFLRYASISLVFSASHRLVIHWAAH